MEQEIAIVNPVQKLELITEYWSPHIISDLNGQYVKLAKLKGEFIWHKHDDEDEMFYVLSGQLRILLRDKELLLNEGDYVVIPRGVEHKPVAYDEVHVMLIEPKTTLNTGDKRDDSLTKDVLKTL